MNWWLIVGGVALTLSGLLRWSERRASRRKTAEFYRAYMDQPYD